MSDDAPPSHPVAQTDAEAPASRTCRYCCGEIPPAAKVCRHCSRHQHPFWQHFRVDQIGILVSVIMIIIVFGQLREARSERIAAAEALERAQAAEANIVTLNDAVREQFLLVASLTWLQLETKNEIGTDRAKVAIEEILKDLNAILPRVLPDPAARQRWVAELQKRLPPRQD